MFGAFFDLLMVPVNFVRKTFGWMPDEAEGDGDGAATETVELQEATVANGGPSASNFAAMQEAVYGDDAAGSTSMSTTEFADLSIYVPDLITTEDWHTLSMAEIDAKLLANGERAIGDPVGDPFYDLTPLEVEELTDSEFQALLDQVDWGLEAPVWDDVITDEDWASLSMAQIDFKLESNGLDPIGAPDEDPFYLMTPDEIDALTDEEYFSMVSAFGWEELYFPAWEEVLLPTDLDTLSPAQVDAKLLEAGFETVGLASSPLYNLTSEDLQLLPETALTQLAADEQDAYAELGYTVAGEDGIITGTGVVEAFPEVISTGSDAGSDTTADGENAWLMG